MDLRIFFGFKISFIKASKREVEQPKTKQFFDKKNVIPFIIVIYQIRKYYFFGFKKNTLGDLRVSSYQFT